MNQRGVTLMELLVYLGMSTIVALGLTAFLTTTTAARVQTSNQHLAQHNGRLVLEKLTHSLRNAYEVVVYNEGNSVDIYSYNFDEPAKPIVTTFSHDAGQSLLLYGQALVSRPSTNSLVPLIEPTVIVDQVTFTPVSASLHVQLTLLKDNGQASLDSTIAFRQPL